MRSLETLSDVHGRRVLVRIDLDVPLDSSLRVVDDTRLRAALPTLRFLVERGARVIIIAHAGRPKGSVVEGLRLTPIVARLSELLGSSILSLKEHAGSAVEQAVANLQPGEILALENLRFSAGEEANDAVFSNTLAALGDVYVNDAFANSHRPYASMVGIPAIIPSYAGFQLMQEITQLRAALSPEHPALAIIGGAKFETKVPVMTKLITTYDTLCVGGALANDFLKTKGFSVGISRTSKYAPTKEFAENPRIAIPTDITADADGAVRIVDASGVAENERIADIGPRTLADWQEKICTARFVLWNGPLGIYEHGFTEPTEALAQTLARSRVRAVVGGGDTIAALRKTDFDPKLVFVSTGGGAMLDFLAQGTLPALEALE